MRLYHIFHHSQLCNNSHSKTCNFFYLPLSTIGTWFEKKSNTSIWLPIFKSLSFQSVLKYIPIFPISNSIFKSYKENVTTSKRMMCGLKNNTKQLIQTKIFFVISTNTHQSIRFHSKDRNDKVF